MKWNKKKNKNIFIPTEIPFFGGSSYSTMFEIFKEFSKPKFATKKSSHSQLIDFLSYNFETPIIFENFDSTELDQQFEQQKIEQQELVEEQENKQENEHTEDEVVDVEFSNRGKPSAKLGGMVWNSYKKEEDGVYDVDFDQIENFDAESLLKEFEERYSGEYRFNILKNEKEFIEENFVSGNFDEMLESNISRIIWERNNPIKKIALNYVDDNSGRLVISDNIAIQKYKQAGFNNLSDDEKKKIFLPTTLADPFDFKKCDQIKVIHEFNKNVVQDQIQLNKNQIKKAIDALGYVENNYNFKGKRVFDLMDINSEIESDLKIYNDIVQNIKFDWYKKHIREDYYLNHNNSFVAPNFSESILEPSIEEVIYDNKHNELDPYIRQVETINNLIQIEEHIKMIKATTVIQWTNNKDSDLLLKHLIFAKTNVDLLLKELLVGVNVIFEQLFLQKTSWIMKSKRQQLNYIFEKSSSAIKSEISRFDKYKDSLSNQNFKTLKTFDDEFKNIVATLKEILEQNNINEIFSGRIGYLIKLRKLFSENIYNIEFLLQIDPYILSKTIINLPNLNPTIEQQLWFTLSEYKQLFITIANFSKVNRKINDKWTKRDLLNFFGRIKSCYKFINGTLSIIKTNVLETKIMIEEGKIDSNVFSAHTEELISMILMLEEDFSKINITNKDQTNLIIKKVLGTWQLIVKKVMTFPVVENTPNLQNLSEFISIANKLVILVINKIYDTVKDWKITSKIAQKISIDINYELASKFDLSLGLEFLDTRAEKTYCNICDLDHKNPIYDETSLITPDDYVNLKKYIDNKLLRITKDYVLETNSDVAHVIFQELVRYKNTNRGIISSLYRLIDFIDSDLTSLYIDLIMADLYEDFEIRRDETMLIYKEIIKKLSFKLYILKHINQQASILEIFEERITKYSPDLSEISTWDNIVSSITNDVVRKIYDLYLESKQQDDDINYFYCELLKEGLLNPEEIYKQINGEVEEEINIDSNIDPDDEYLNHINELFSLYNEDIEKEKNIIGFEVLEEKEWEEGTRPTGNQLQIYKRNKEQTFNDPQNVVEDKVDTKQDVIEDIKLMNIDKNIIRIRENNIYTTYINIENIEQQLVKEELDSDIQTKPVEFIETIEQLTQQEPKDFKLSDNTEPDAKDYFSFDIKNNETVKQPNSNVVQEINQPDVIGIENVPLIRKILEQDKIVKSVNLFDNTEPDAKDYFSFNFPSKKSTVQIQKPKQQIVEDNNVETLDTNDPVLEESIYSIPQENIQEDSFETIDDYYTNDPVLEESIYSIPQEDSFIQSKNQNPIIIYDDVLVSEFLVDSKPSDNCEYKQILDDSSNDVIQNVKFVNLDEFNKYFDKQSNKKNEKPESFMKTIQQDKSKVAFDVYSNENYINNDIWTSDEFIK